MLGREREKEISKFYFLQSVLQNMHVTHFRVDRSLYAEHPDYDLLC